MIKELQKNRKDNQQRPISYPFFFLVFWVLPSLFIPLFFSCFPSVNWENLNLSFCFFLFVWWYNCLWWITLISRWVLFVFLYGLPIHNWTAKRQKEGEVGGCERRANKQIIWSWRRRYWYGNSNTTTRPINPFSTLQDSPSNSNSRQEQ